MVIIVTTRCRISDISTTRELIESKPVDAQDAMMFISAENCCFIVIISAICAACNSFTKELSHRQMVKRRTLLPRMNSPTWNSCSITLSKRSSDRAIWRMLDVGNILRENTTMKSACDSKMNLCLQRLDTKFQFFNFWQLCLEFSVLWAGSGLHVIGHLPLPLFTQAA
jgi:hypothetical protein